MGMSYARVTKTLGFVPDRHEGKILNLAAYGHAGNLKDVDYLPLEEVPVSRS
jgi:predicted NodU family carbamoyl transferase